MVGELSIVGGGVRSATAVAETQVRCHRLSAEALDRIHREQPALAWELLRSLGWCLSRRILIANRIATELEG